MNEKEVQNIHITVLLRRENREINIEVFTFLPG